MFLWIFRNFIILASDNDEHNMLTRQKMKTRIRLYIHMHVGTVKLCLLRGQKPCRGSNTINAWKQNPPKWEKFLTYSSPLKQPMQGATNGPALIAIKVTMVWSTQAVFSTMEVKRTSLFDKSSSRNCYTRCSAPNQSFVYDRIWVHPFIPPFPSQQCYNPNKTHFHVLIFLYLCCVIYFIFLYLFYFILFISFQNSTLFGVGGGRSVNSFTHWKVQILLTSILNSW